MILRLLWVHTYYITLELLRQPMYLISTLIFPSMFFWFFAVPNATDETRALMLTGSFAGFAILGVMLFQFGVAIAQEKETPWASYLRVLPVPGWLPLASRVISGLFFAIFAVLGVIATAELTTPLVFEVDVFQKFFGVLLLGSIPFGLLGLVIGLWCKPATALPVGNLVYLPLSFAGGLWVPPNALPDAVQKISEYLPTRMFGELIWNSLLSTPLEARYPWGLFGYGLGALLLGAFLYQRREEQTFR